MPRLLKNGMVQLHMPRTGGRSLAEDIGIKAVKGSIHDGYNFIPSQWKDKPIIATWRDRESWERSISTYMIDKLGRSDPNFYCHNNKANLTLGFWGNAGHHMDLAGLQTKERFRCLYDLWSCYFLSKADIIIPITKLKNHIK